MIRTIHELASAPPAYDVCIVGAGAAGITLAVDLLRQNKRVLLLESGGRIEDARTAQLKEFDLAGLPHTGATEGRFRTLGGTTTRWGGQIAEFDPQDFEARPWIEGSGWPFQKEVLAPYYQRVYKHVQLDPARLEDAAVWRSLGVTPPTLGHVSLYFTRWLRQPNFSILFHETLEKNPNLDVVLQANLVEIHVEESGQVREVVAAALDGTRQRFTAGNFVIATGAMETSRLLLQPRADGGLQPWGGSAWIGRHFQDHLAGYCGVVNVKDWQLVTDTFTNVFYGDYKYNPKMKLSREMQERERILNVGGTLNFLPKEGVEDPLAALKALRQSRTVKNVLKVLAKLPTALKAAYRLKAGHRVYYEQASTQVLLGVECEQEPLGGSTISLSSTRDETGLFKATLDWQISTREIETIRTFALTAAADCEAAGVGSVDIDPELLAGSPAFVAKLHDTLHHMGGTRMASHPDDGAVDEDLRLFGTTNLYILSASVFPTSSYSNPTCTLMALAFRLADRLATLDASSLNGAAVVRPSHV